MKNELIITLLKEEQTSLQETLNQIRKELENAPEGSVQIRKHKKSVQFYHRHLPGNLPGNLSGNSPENLSENPVTEYIPAARRTEAVAIVQKRYLQRMEKAIEQQLRAIASFLKRYVPDALSRVYSQETPLRQPFITPLLLSDHEYIRKWESVSYDRKPFPENSPVHYTLKNEQVRSKSEMMIANALFRAGIPYRYEYPFQNRRQVIHPDFTILRISDRKELFWEHLGMMDDTEYRNQAFQRIRDYEALSLFPGIDLILTFETGRMPLNTKIIERTINAYLNSPY